MSSTTSPVSTSADARRVSLLVGVVSEALAATGLEGGPAGPARYFTDASALVPLLTPSGGAPVPTVILGPGEPDQCHVADEWCSVSKVDQAVEVYAELLRRWCAG